MFVCWGVIECGRATVLVDSTHNQKHPVCNRKLIFFFTNDVQESLYISRSVVY